MNWQKVDKILPKEMATVQSRAKIEGAQVCRLWHGYSGQLFLSRTMKNHEAINFRDGVLTVVVSNSLIAAELKPYERRIVSQINRALGKSLVHSVRYR